METYYDYGEIDPDSVFDPNKNTGNIAKQTISFSGLAAPFVQTFRYDTLYRIKEAIESSGGAQTLEQTFAYDRYSNWHRKIVC